MIASGIKRLALLVTLIASILTGVVFTTGCPETKTPTEAERQQKVANLVGAVPAAVRLVIPGISVLLSTALDEGAALFKTFTTNPTVSNWQKALDHWNQKTRPNLERLGSNSVKRIVAAVDLLMSQITVPEVDVSARASTNDAPVEIRFTDDAVRELDQALKAAKREAKK